MSSQLKRFVWEKRISWQGKTLQYLQKLREWQWLSSEELRELQQRQLRALLQHAYEYTAYYRQLFDQHHIVNRQGQVEMERFAQIPFLDKTILRQQYASLLSADLHNRNWYLNSSGGSTGDPVEFIRDKDYFFWSEAIKALDDEWTGRALTDRQVRLWASPREIAEGNEYLRTRVGRWLRNELWCNAFCMGPDEMYNFVKKMNSFRPVQLLAYAESLYELAKFCERKRLAVYSPRAIMTSAGVLYEPMRQTIQRVFQAPVFNRYGSMEAGDIACECEYHTGLHVSSPTHYIEIVDSQGNPAPPGEIGEIIVTLLREEAMPFIRYRIGDMGAWGKEPCPCGRGLPLLQEVSGRVTDMFIDRQGVWVDGRVFLYALDSRMFISKFQVIQEQPDMLTVKIVPRQWTDDPQKTYAAETQEVVRVIQQIMDCEVRVEYYQELLPTPSGKYRYTISHVPH
ncbi:phenylacetate--CoA ligase family protein [Brevibacillus fulvus]|uniref:Phenylacetate-CoA ligase n=1 Tax=Brevibacillus fulvus TaxID=1125967 RepID=A0A938XWD5_9BACL|nr:phenylacetate--CoA ligase family protein [Brevibacillus fulvus]MBM7588898.1 phenylacetate-CoA ligase [Brevibacillus fulvus]